MQVHKACLRKTSMVKHHQMILLSKKEKADFAEKNPEINLAVHAFIVQIYSFNRNTLKPPATHVML